MYEDLVLQLLQLHGHFSAMFKTLHGVLRHLLARGRSNAVQQRVRRVQEARHSNDSKELSRACIFFIHELCGRDVARTALWPLSVLHHEDGTPCLDALDIPML